MPEILHRPLLERLAPLRDLVPWVDLADGLPTPLHRLDDGLWVKRDDQSASLYGGNKVRKLELIVAQAKARGGPIVTTGATGSHFALATAVHAARHQVPVVVIRFPQPPNDHVREMAAALEATDAEIVEVSRTELFPMVQAWEWAKRRRSGALFVPTGGSSPLGALGYVNAALEVVQQWPAGEPPPHEVIVAMSSSGTVVGLALGLALAGWHETTVVGVRVADAIVTNRAWVGQLHHRTRRILRRAGAPSLSTRVEIDTGWLGKGYGAPTPEGRAAADVALERHGLPTEPTYTAKAFAAVLARHRPGRRTLYVHTYAG